MKLWCTRDGQRGKQRGGCGRTRRTRAAAASKSGVVFYLGGGGTSRAQPLQSGCSFRETRCLGAHVPANVFGHVCSNTATALVAFSDIEQCLGKSFGGGKLVTRQYDGYTRHKLGRKSGRFTNPFVLTVLTYDRAR